MRNLKSLVPVAALVIAAPLSAQSIAANGMTSASENKAERAPIFTGAAYIPAAKKMGFGLQTLTYRTSEEDAGDEYVTSSTALALTGYYGVTNRISVGAYLPYVRYSEELTVGGTSVDASESGLGDAGLFTRFAAYQTKSGNTRVSVGAELTFATGDSLFTNDETLFQVDAPISHRLGRWNMHVVPGIETAVDRDMYMNLNLAGVYSMSERMGLSVELLNKFGGAPSNVDGAEGVQDIDLGAGLRYRFAGRTGLDFGLRYNVAQNLPAGVEKPSVLGATFGLHMAF